ncbi:hypothetical protein GCM10009613_14870 [Pseudonocardia kongjuensis]|uniref:Polysaccharide chain length determinant N-terminal domain-containing protein n=1 Tax=Pseudonocardia kongjuensis TaxID=102227 RepID=A0ABN1XNN3_9PSEU
MTTRAYVAVLRRQWPWIAGVLLLCVGAAAVATVVLPRTYQAQTTIYVSGQADGEYPVAVVEATLSRMPSYRQLLTEDPVLDGAIDQLGMAESADDLRGRLVVDNEPQSLLLKLSATDGDPARAAAVANSVARSFVRVASSLDTPTVAGRPPVVSARIVNVANPPTDPISPQSGTTMGLGLVAGLILGVAAAFAMDTRGRRIRTAAALAEAAPAAHLGSTLHRPEPDTGTPVGMPAADAADFRRLAANLQMVDLAHEHKAIVVTGPRPATGATTTACNLAVALAAEGRRVALIDADLAGRRIATTMRIESVGGLTAVLTGQTTFGRAMRTWSGGPGLSVLDAGTSPPSAIEFLRSPQMGTLIEELRIGYEIVVFDAPPLLDGPEAAVLAAQVDGAVLCCRSGRTTSREVAAALTVLDDASATLLGTVLTHTQDEERNPTTTPTVPPVPPRPSPGPRTAGSVPSTAGTGSPA